MRPHQESNTTQGPTIRRGTVADVEGMASLFLAARREMLSFVPMVHPDDSVVPWMRDHLFAGTEIWVAEQEGHVIAFLSLSPGWIEHLYVRPGHQGGGIGRRLVALAKASGHAAYGLDLWTFQSNLRARSFYEREGFTAIEFTDGSGNEEQTPDVRYSWRAGP